MEGIFARLDASGGTPLAEFIDAVFALLGGFNDFRGLVELYGELEGCHLGGKALLAGFGFTVELEHLARRDARKEGFLAVVTAASYADAGRVDVDVAVWDAEGACHRDFYHAAVGV
jgi:hypothetical protein